MRARSVVICCLVGCASATTNSAGIDAPPGQGDGASGDGTAVSMNVKAVAAGSQFTCALKLDGAVMCWGHNDRGELGDGTTVDRRAPVAVVGLGSGVQAITAGLYNMCALTAAGGVMCWGFNGAGELGNGTFANSPTPVSVSGLDSGVVAIAGTGETMCVLTAAGAVKCWGDNGWGRIGDGDGTVEYRTAPRDVVGLTGGIASLTHCGNGCVVGTAGGVKCWGPNLNGGVGDGTTIDRPAPVDVPALQTGMARVAAGGSHNCALSTGGRISCWGFNQYGQVGDGSHTDRHAPTEVVSSGAIALGIGYQTSFAITSDGLLAWGLNDLGMLGDGTTTAKSSPVSVTGIGGHVTQVSSSRDHTCAVLEGGRLQCWGNNMYGQLGDGSTATVRLAPVDVTVP